MFIKVFITWFVSRCGRQSLKTMSPLRNAKETPENDFDGDNEVQKNRN